MLICDELLEIANYIELEINSYQTPITNIINQLNVENYTHIDFINLKMLKERTIPKTPLSFDDNMRISSFFYSLGKYDVRNQIVQINSFREYIKLRRQGYQIDFEKKSKIYVAFGISAGVILALSFV